MLLFIQKSAAICAISLAIATSPSLVLAQCDSTKQLLLDIADEAGPIGGTKADRVPISNVSPDFTFYAVSDSAVVKYWVSNFYHNDSRLLLDRWCYHQSIDVDDSSPNFNKTQIFTFNPGDKIGVFREFWW